MTETQREPFVGIRPRALREYAAAHDLTRADRQMLTDLLLHAVDYRTGMWPRRTERRQRTPSPAPLDVLATELGCSERTLRNGLDRLAGIVHCESIRGHGVIVVIVRYSWLVHLTEDQKSAVETSIASFLADGPDPFSESELLEARETGVTTQTFSTDASPNGETAKSGSTGTSQRQKLPERNGVATAEVAGSNGRSCRSDHALTPFVIEEDGWPVWQGEPTYDR